MANDFRIVAIAIKEFVNERSIIYLSLDICTDKNGNRIWPGNGLVLIPPPPYNDRHIKAKHEWHWY